MSNWEGGIRVSSFISGGIVSNARRGTVYRGLVSAFDFYATILSLAGGNTSDPAAEAAGLPPVDGMDLSAVLLGSTPTPPGGLERLELVIGTQDATVQNVAGLLWMVRADSQTGAPARLYKLLTGVQNQNAHSAPLSPNSTENATLGFPPALPDEFTLDCTDQGCLYELLGDADERINLASPSAPPRVAQIVAHMQIRLREARRTSLVRSAGPTDEKACVAAEKRGGYWGPWL
jgi:hypothetical protein